MAEVRFANSSLVIGTSDQSPDKKYCPLPTWHLTQDSEPQPQPALLEEWQFFLVLTFWQLLARVRFAGGPFPQFNGQAQEMMRS